MKVIISIGHPAHFHLFKNLAFNLRDNNNMVKFVLTDKDILIKLLDSYDFDYEVLAFRKENERKSDKIAKIKLSTKKLKIITEEFKPDIMIGCLSQMTWIGMFEGIPTIFCGEDDFSYTYMQGCITFPFTSAICAPIATGVGPFKYKKCAYNGFQKLAYLHPNQFTPNKDVLKNIDISKSFYIIRLVNLEAYHDISVKGLSADLLQKLINKLEQHGTVYLSSEKELSNDMKKYQLPTNIEDIHHAMYYADMYIGDSQSMAVEAAMLGTPSIRYNDFAGKIGVLEELEHKYKLTYGIGTSKPERLFAKVEELLKTPNLKEEFQKRREHMLSEKIDVTAFFTWFIENYPESKRIMKENPDYQYRFK